ncbi:MalY/PatB family protein [Hespellia stercorisuis]|uniref:cysteine-S-conjugate beta-lyase n=1 Tax=Hespellia stercorisuis DSM 15480 TaxID=1121950 RepID=A0A1M6TVS6_9FIRM|nr:MalY/PatB family protein [Hespellia stercorisuis]SHK60994.1 cystathione beta-lyase [Hespellia stercorisuis DSM 15480]
MKNYDFNELVNRKGSACIKWDFQAADFGHDGLLPFTIADADYPTCPSVTAALSKGIQTGIIGYTDVDDSYYNAVINWCLVRHQWNIKKDWIVPTSGIIPGIAFVLESMTQPEDPIVVQPPVYDPFYSAIRATGRTIVKNELIADENNRYTMDYAHLEECFQRGAKAFILCNPHNPIGRVWSRKELERVRKLCREYHVLLISDEIHWDIVYAPSIHTSIGTLCDENDFAVVCTSGSKTFNIAGLQTSNFIIMNPDLRQTFQDYLYGRYLFCPNTLGLIATKYAYSTGAEWVDAQLLHLKSNAEKVVAFMKAHLPFVKVTFLEGTYLMWLDFTYYHRSSGELVTLFSEYGAAVGDGTHYSPKCDGFIRLNIACPKAQLTGGLECIRRAVQSLNEEDQ